MVTARTMKDQLTGVARVVALLDDGEGQHVPLHRVFQMTVHGSDRENLGHDAAEQMFVIGNRDDNPGDDDGRIWPHRVVRSLSVRDVVGVLLSYWDKDGRLISPSIQLWRCEHFGWRRVPLEGESLLMSQALNVISGSL